MKTEQLVLPPQDFNRLVFELLFQLKVYIDIRYELNQNATYGATYFFWKAISPIDNGQQRDKLLLWLNNVQKA